MLLVPWDCQGELVSSLIIGRTGDIIRLVATMNILTQSSPPLN